MPAECIRVVIADDDRPFALLARSYLESFGFEVADVVGDRRCCVELCRRNRPDVLLLDIAMQELEGTSVADQVLREVGETTVILLSAMTNEELIERAVELGMTHYHVKPITRDQLRACILSAVAADRRRRAAERRLNERTVVQRAEGQGVESRRTSEAEVWCSLRTESENRWLPIDELENALLMADDSLAPSK